jgi:hypothetical protein
VALGRIWIRRLLPPPWLLEAHGKRAEDFAAQWFVAFTFPLQPQGPRLDQFIVGGELALERTVVCLLDGSYAVEKKEPVQVPKFKAGPPCLAGQQTDGPPHTRPPESGYTNRPPLADPHRMIHSPDFELPKVQWDASRIDARGYESRFADEFPMNLKSQLHRAKAYAASEKSVPESSLVLEGI